MKNKMISEIFEPSMYTFIGYVFELWESRNTPGIFNANIKPVSIRDGSQWIPLTSPLVKKIPSVVGDDVFAYSITTTLPDIKLYSFIEFKVRESSNDKGSKYQVDYKHFLVKEVALPTVIDVDYLRLDAQAKKNFFDPDKLKMKVEQYVDGRCYLRGKSEFEILFVGPFRMLKKEDEYHVSPYKGKDAYVRRFQNGKQYLGNVVPLPDGHGKMLNESDITTFGEAVDCMTLAQLVDWGKCLAKSVEGVDSNIIRKVFKEIASNSFSDRMVQNRLARLGAEFENYADFVSVSEEVLGKLVDKYVARNPQIKEEAKKKILLECDELEARKNDLRTEEKNLLSKVEEKRAEYDSIESEVAAKRTKLESDLSALRKKHVELTADVSRLLDALDMIEERQSDESGLKYVEVSENRKTQFAECCENSSVDITVDLKLKQNAESLGFGKEFVRSLGAYYSFLNCRAMFVPNISWAYAYGKVIGNARIAAIFPEYDWLHYKDYKSAGLEKVWLDAFLHPEWNYILYIDGINIASPESGLRPLLDIIEGRSLAMGNTGKGWPRNLHIMASVLPAKSDDPDEKIGLKLRPERFSRWGAVSEPGDSTTFSTLDFMTSEVDVGFSPDDLVIDDNVDDTPWQARKEKYFAY